MVHYAVLVIIPRKVYLEGKKSIFAHIDHILHDYDEKLEIEPYVISTVEQLKAEFDLYKKDTACDDHFTIAEYAEYREMVIDENGNEISTYNKNAIFDWYQVGGRWDGVLSLERVPQFLFDEESRTIQNNSIAVDELLKGDHSTSSFFPLIFDKNGKLYFLYKNGEFDNFPFSEKIYNDDQWKGIYLKILNDAHGDFVVNLDVHI